MVESATYDVAIIGSGIVGLAHAVAARKRGLSVVVIERSSGVLGASIRNFGHICLTGQAGQALEYAELSRPLWIELARETGLWMRECGTVVVAQAPDEVSVLEQFRDDRGADDIVLLSSDEVLDRVPVAHGIPRGGAWLPRDLQVDPREAAASIARWLAVGGVEFRMRTTVLGVESGLVHTSRGEISAETVIVAVNHDVDQLFPELAENAAVERCGLDMMRVDADLRIPFSAPLFTGWSLVRYPGFAGMDSAAIVRARLAADHPDLFALDLNQMYTQTPNGSLIVGDTHYRDVGIPPFQSEFAFQALLQQARVLFGTDRLRVQERWQGVYATAPADFLIASPADGVCVVSVTTGIGMTTGLGLGESVINDLYASSHSHATTSTIAPAGRG
jgi:D-hydroxyproline dehydrogenase subunit beta